MQAVCLLTYLRSAQQPTVAAPPRSAAHPTTSLLEDYAYNGFLLEVGPEWSLATILHAIKKGPHSSTIYMESMAFCRGGILERNQQGFSIVLMEEDAIVLFGNAIYIPRLASVDQIN